MLLPRTLSNPVSSAARRILVPQKKKTGMKRISHAKSVKSKSVSFIGYCETAALCSTGKKGRNKVGKQLHPSLYAHTRGWYGTKYVGSVRRSQLEVMARKWVLAPRKNKSRLSVSTAQVQTPAAVAGGDALAGRVLERPPQRKTRRALSEQLAWWVCDKRNKKRCLDVHNDNTEIHEGWKIRVYKYWGSV